MQKLRSILAPLLVVAHVDETVVRRGRAVLLAAYGLLLVCIAAVPVLLANRSEIPAFLNVVAALLIYGGVIAATRRGHVLPAAITFNLMNALGPGVSALTNPVPSTPFYLVFIPLLAAATLPPPGVAAASASLVPLLVARYLQFGADSAIAQDTLSAGLVLLLTSVVGIVFSITSESSIRRLSGALADLAELNGTLEARVRDRTAALAAAEQRRRDTMKGVGHDMGNLLMAMSGNVSFALDALDDGDSGAVRHYLDRFEAVTTRLGRVARDLVDSALAETGHLTLQPVPVDLAAATSKVLDELESTIALTGLAVSVSCPRACLAYADPDRVKRVLHNVVGNALKFTPGGGQVTVSIAVHDDRVVWACSDTGCGIEPERLNQLGQELRRFDPDSTQGMGLGLYTSTLIVQASGGEIAYHSEGRGAGTTVSISLPRFAGDADVVSPALAARAS
jgi:signal transduction histidine kinase